MSSSPIACKQDRMLTACCFTSARWTTLKSDYGSRRRQRARLPVQSVRFRIQIIELWAVQIVNRVLSKWRGSRSTAQMIARRSRCAVLFLGLASVRNRDQYPTGLTAPYGCFCATTQPIWPLQASVSSFMWPVVLQSVKTGGSINAYFSGFMNLSSFLLRGQKFVG